MTKFLKKVLVFVKSNWIMIVSFLGFIVAMLGLAFCREGRVPSLIASRKYDIAKDKQEIARLKGYKEALSVDRSKNESELANVDHIISKVDEEIQEKISKIDTLKSEQKLKEFDDLGY